MLNRRVLRIKAMQSIYAFMKSRSSAYVLAKKSIAEEYHEIAMIEGQEHKLQRDEEQSKALHFFEDNYLNENYLALHTPKERYLEVADKAVRKYQNAIGKDFRSTKAKMITDTQNLMRSYLKALQTLVDLANFATQNEERINGAKLPAEKSIHALLSKNQIVQLLAENELLKKEVSRQNISNERDFIGNLFYILQREEAFFQAINTPNETEDIAPELRAPRYFFKNFLLKKERLVNAFEEQDLNWSENRPILRSMLLKTLKRIEQEKEKDTPLMELSKNWEDDKAFFEELFKKFWKTERFFEEILRQKSNRWSLERVAEVDKVLIGMGVTEMLHFPSIPTKVSINEYIEIAKQYSTPKSAIFLNGILDSISSELTAQGKIQKSGRGLLNQ